MEERILKLVNDQVNATMASAQATTLKDLAEKMEHIKFWIGQLRERSSISSPSHRSTDGYGLPKGQKGGFIETTQRIKVQPPDRIFHPSLMTNQKNELRSVNTPLNCITAVTSFKGEASAWYRGFSEHLGKFIYIFFQFSVIEITIILLAL
jgi:hypothetical protein